MFGNCYIQQPPSPWMDVGSRSAENMWNSSELICLLEENPRSFLPIDKFRIRSPIQGCSWLGDVPSQLLSREGQDMCLQGHLPALNFLLLLNWWVVHFLGGKGHLWNNSSLHVPQSPGAKTRQLEDYATSDQRCRAHLIRREHSIAIFWKTHSPAEVSQAMTASSLLGPEHKDRVLPVAASEARLLSLSWLKYTCVNRLKEEEKEKEDLGRLRRTLDSHWLSTDVPAFSPRHPALYLRAGREIE